MVDSNPNGNAQAGPSRGSIPQAPAFQPAKSLLPAGTTSNSGSLRNASNGIASASASASSTGDAATNGSNGATNATSTSTTGEAGSAAAVAAAGPVKPVHRSASSKNAIIYSAVQRRNPLLAAIKNVPTEIGDIPADYQVGTHNGVLFLSLKYHRLHPEYIHQRIEKMRGIYQLRILMILCDVSEHQLSLRELTKIAIINNFSTIVAWSNDEIAQYLTTFKQSEHKSADTLKEKVHQSYHDQLQHVLTSGKKVNKTDAFNMASQFGSFANMSSQSAKMIATVKGLGPTKVTTLVDAFTKPFVIGGLKRSEQEAGTGSSTSGGAKEIPVGSEAGASGRSRAAGNGAKSSSNGGGKGKGKAKEVVEDDEDIGSPERFNSPDWPSDPSDEEGEEAEERGASGTAKGSAVWKDPLEDDDADSEDGLSGGGNVGVSRKKQRTE